MSWTQRDKWVAFWLSLAVPGAGQLWAGRWSCLAYFAAAGGLVATVPGAFSWAALAALGLVGAEHAKRCVEGDRWRGRAKSAVTRSRLVDRSGRGRRIVLAIEIEVARSPTEVWARIADFREFATIDPFHSRIIVLGPELRPGVALALEHRAFGVKFLRFGRLLWWREGRGYAFSDLSGRAGGLGVFPHIFDFAVGPAAPGSGSTRLTVGIRGKWTSRRLPRWAALWWFRYVCREHARLLKAALNTCEERPRCPPTPPVRATASAATPAC